MARNLFADRRKLAPERFEIEREFASVIHPMRVGYKQFIAAAGNPIDGDDAALWSANDGLAITCQQDLRSNWLGSRAGRAAGKAVSIADRVRHDVATTSHGCHGPLGTTPSTVSRHFLQNNNVSLSSHPCELATEERMCAFVDVPIQKRKHMVNGALAPNAGLQWLGACLQYQPVTCRWIQNRDDSFPVACKDLGLGLFGNLLAQLGAKAGDLLFQLHSLLRQLHPVARIALRPCREHLLHVTVGLLRDLF